jgi:hypothetical protein
MNQNLSRKILSACRIILGLTFLLSAIGKLINSDDARYLVELMSMEIYWLIEFKTLIVLSLTIIELIIGLLLLLNKALKTTFIISIALLLFMTSVLGYFLLQDMEVESCGCFGVFDIFKGPVATIGKNVLLMIIASVGVYLQGKKRR